MIRKLLLGLLILIILFVGFQIITFPRVGRLKNENPETTAFMDQRRAELRREGRDDALRHTWVSYESISPHLRSAVIVSEDSRFYEHGGIDQAELEKVLREAWEKKELGRGGSTITQQLAKNLYLSSSRNPFRKLKEIVIAWRMEQVLSKKRILELYLNLVEFGETVYGAEAASRHYFGKPASGLTPGEAALLAGALPNPRKMNPGSPGPYLRSRRDIIVSRMQRWGYMAERSVASAPAPEDEETSDPLPGDPQPDQEDGEEESNPDPTLQDPFGDDQPIPADFIPVEPSTDETPEQVEPPPQDDPSGVDPPGQNVATTGSAPLDAD